MPGRDQAGIGKAGLERRLRLAVDHGDLVAVLLQMPGGRDAGEAGAKDRDAHAKVSRARR